MSSAAPGASYLFPRFDYGAGELFQATLPTQVLPAGFPLVTVAKANSSGALRLANITCFLRGNAAVGTRTIQLRLFDANTVDVYQAGVTLNVVANSIIECNWQTNVTSAFSTGNIAFTPLVDFVIPPGWSYALQCNATQAGDTLEGISAVGVVYPAVTSTDVAIPTVPQPLFA